MLLCVSQIPEACKFIHEQLRIDAPPFSSDDDPALSSKAGGRVLIQCKTGNKQGAIVAMAYMIVKMGFAPWKALHTVAFARAQVRGARAVLCCVVDGPHHADSACTCIVLDATGDTPYHSSERVVCPG